VSREWSGTTNMKSLASLFAIVLLSWFAVVTFCGPELYRIINGPEPVKAKAVIRRAR
jgi:hypothetical protein